MSKSQETRKWRDEPVTAMMAFIAAFLLALFVGVSIVVGIARNDPRDAAILMIVPAAIIALVAARWAPTRRLFSMWYIGG